MTKGKYPRSVAKYLRRQKARIRRKTQDRQKQEELIAQVVQDIDASRLQTK